MPGLVVGLLVAILALVIMAVVPVARSTDEGLLRRFAFVKRRDRVLRNGEFVGAVATLVAIETVLFLWLGYPSDLWIPVVALSAYLPIAFLFHCNILLIGTRRELIWAGGLVILCAGSLLVWSRVRLDLVIAGGIAMTAFFSWRAGHDAFSHLRRGLQRIDEARRTRSGCDVARESASARAARLDRPLPIRACLPGMVTVENEAAQGRRPGPLRYRGAPSAAHRPRGRPGDWSWQDPAAGDARHRASGPDPGSPADQRTRSPGATSSGQSRGVVTIATCRPSDFSSMRLG
jgi:hypothetical protein